MIRLKSRAWGRIVEWNGTETEPKVEKRGMRLDGGNWATLVGRKSRRVCITRGHILPGSEMDPILLLSVNICENPSAKCP